MRNNTKNCVNCDRAEARFWSWIDNGPHPKGCWLWTGCTYNRGYGVIHWAINGKPKKLVAAHRVAYVLTKGHFPNHLEVIHSCDERLCCNPAHLRVGTHQENMADAKRKGRHAHGERGRAKLTESKVLEIRRLYKKTGPRRGNGMKLAAMFNVSRAAIQAVLSRRSWKHL